MKRNAKLSYTLAGMPQLPWQGKQLLTPQIKTAIIACIKKGYKKFLFLGPETLKKNVCIAYTLAALDDHYDYIGEGDVDEIGYYKPHYNFSDIKLEETTIGIFPQVDHVPPLQVQTMRAVMASLEADGAPLVISAETVETAAKALGPLFDRIDVRLQVKTDPKEKLEVKL